MVNDHGHRLTPNADIEQMPTPSNPEKRDVVQRLEVNAKSLKALCADLPAFVDRAEKESIKTNDERDEETMKNTHAYFSRLYALLARISNDIAGHEYTSRNVRRAVQSEEASDEMINNLRDSFTMIEEALQSANRQTIIPDSSNRGHARNKTSDLFPFGDRLDSIEETVQDMRRVVGS